MKLSLEALKINRFDNSSNFIHAVSPRYFKNKKGELEQYDFTGKEGSEKKSNHINRFMKMAGIKNKIPYWVNQVHGDQIFFLKDNDKTPDQVSKINADALITHLNETPVGVFTADCVPVLLYDPRNHVAAAIHAGRKGVQENIVFKVVMGMVREYGSRPQDLVAGLGPGIRGCCYEVDQSCLNVFNETIPRDPAFVTSKTDGKFLLDLFAVNIRQALDAGLLQKNIFQNEECTFCSPRKHFSYRREGPTGRILTFIMLKNVKKNGLT